jgi:chemotaxis regulatin CheY-phosphate phosphatase CheZ
MRALRDALSGLLGGEAAAGGGPGPAIDRAAVLRTLADLDARIMFLEKEYNGQLQSSDRYMIVNDNYSMVRKEDHDRLVAALEASDNVIQCIIANISRILESLSFQDLSGQRSIKIVDLLSNVQIQLLSILVSSGVKLKRLREGRAIEKISAEAEADELMSRFRAGAAKDGPGRNILDQQAIDSLLSDLGF